MIENNVCFPEPLSAVTVCIQGYSGTKMKDTIVSIFKC